MQLLFHCKECNSPVLPLKLAGFHQGFRRRSLALYCHSRVRFKSCSFFRKYDSILPVTVLVFRLWKWLTTACVSCCHADWAIWPRWPFTCHSMRTQWQYEESCPASCAGEGSRRICESCASTLCPQGSACGLTSHEWSTGRGWLCIQTWRGDKRADVMQLWRVLTFKGLDVSQWRKSERNTWHKYDVNPDTNHMPFMLWVFCVLSLLFSCNPGTQIVSDGECFGLEAALCLCLAGLMCSGRSSGRLRKINSP